MRKVKKTKKVQRVDYDVVDNLDCGDSLEDKEEQLVDDFVDVRGVVADDDDAVVAVGGDWEHCSLDLGGMNYVDWGIDSLAEVDKRVAHQTLRPLLLHRHC